MLSRPKTQTLQVGRSLTLYSLDRTGLRAYGHRCGGRNRVFALQEILRRERVSWLNARQCSMQQ